MSTPILYTASLILGEVMSLVGPAIGATPFLHTTDALRKVPPRLLDGVMSVTFLSHLFVYYFSNDDVTILL